jgi:hypothetical protein
MLVMRLPHSSVLATTKADLPCIVDNGHNSY